MFKEKQASHGTNPSVFMSDVANPPGVECGGCSQHPCAPTPPTCPCLLAAACKESKRPLEVSQHSEEMGLILGICAGGLIVLIILLGAIIVAIRKG